MCMHEPLQKTHCTFWSSKKLLVCPLFSARHPIICSRSAALRRNNSQQRLLIYVAFGLAYWSGQSSRLISAGVAVFWMKTSATRLSAFEALGSVNLLGCLVLRPRKGRQKTRASHPRDMWEAGDQGCTLLLSS